MPNRILKESICTSETIDGMTSFEEVFFYRLIVNCDDYGCMDARPKILKAKLFPLKERVTLKEISGALVKLAELGCVRLYESDSKPYLYLPAWEGHQSIRAKKRKYPEPCNMKPEIICNHMKSSEINCKQMKSNESKCSRNPIQSESNPNTNPNPNPTAGADVFSAYAKNDVELLKALEDFAKMRKTAKKPMTDRAKKLLCTELDKLKKDGNDLITCINQSILYNWQSVYPEKREKKQEESGTYDFAALEKQAFRRVSG